MRFAKAFFWGAISAALGACSVNVPDTSELFACRIGDDCSSDYVCENVAGLPVVSLDQGAADNKYCVKKEASCSQSNCAQELVCVQNKDKGSACNSCNQVGCRFANEVCVASTSSGSGYRCTTACSTALANCSSGTQSMGMCAPISGYDIAKHAPATVQACLPCDVGPVTYTGTTSPEANIESAKGKLACGTVTSPWYELGSSGTMSLSACTTGLYSHPAIALDNNRQPYVAFLVGTVTGGQVCVMHWNGTAWQPMPSLGTSANATSPAIAMTSFDAPAVAWAEQGKFVHLLYYSSAWVAHDDSTNGVYSGTDPGLSMGSSTSADSVSLSINGNKIAVAWIENLGSGPMAYYRVWDSNWNGTSGIQITGAGTYAKAVAASYDASGTLGLAWKVCQTTTTNCSAWARFGAGSDNQIAGFGDEQFSTIRLGFFGGTNPAVAIDSGTTQANKISKLYITGAWTTQALPNSSAPTAPSLARDKADNAVVAWINNHKDVYVAGWAPPTPGSWADLGGQTNNGVSNRPAGVATEVAVGATPPGTAAANRVCVAWIDQTANGLFVRCRD